MSVNPDRSSVEDLNLALRRYRRLLFRVFAIFVLGIVALIALAYLGTWLSPPYGVYVLGQDLMTWGMIAALILLLAEIWWDGRQIGRALNDKVMLYVPALGVLSGLSLIAQRANAVDMEWSGFFGPLRPVRRRRPDCGTASGHRRFLCCAAGVQTEAWPE